MPTPDLLNSACLGDLGDWDHGVCSPLEFRTNCPVDWKVGHGNISGAAIRSIVLCNMKSVRAKKINIQINILMIIEY